MGRYKRYTRKRLFNPFMICAFIVIVILVMSVGYAEFTDKVSINGIANAKYTMYEITYVLNGGTNPENVITSFRSVDDIPLPIPTKSGFKFVGWYNNEDCIGTKISTTGNIKEDVTLYAKWKLEATYDEQFSYNGEYVFTGNNYIDTGVYLYTAENLHKNFIISFDIVDVASSNVNHSALMNSMNESGSPWSGHVVKVSGNGSSKSLKFESNSNTSSTGDVYISNDVKNVRIIRIGDILYYSFDGGYCIKINDYRGFKNTFDVPVTFGASMDGNKNPFRYFTGTLANMSVGFLDDNAIINDFNPQKDTVMKTKYEYIGSYEFDGESYIDTGLCLFTQENIYKDFEISFNIDSVDPDNESQATIVNVKNERINSYPGFVYRIYPTTDNTIRFESKGGSGSGARNKIKDVHKVKISRIDSKIYLTINDGESKEVYNFTGFGNFYEVPLTIGASLDSNGNPFRFFKGSLSNIVIKVEE